MQSKHLLLTLSGALVLSWVAFMIVMLKSGDANLEHSKSSLAESRHPQAAGGAGADDLAAIRSEEDLVALRGELALLRAQVASLQQRLDEKETRAAEADMPMGLDEQAQRYQQEQLPSDEELAMTAMTAMTEDEAMKQQQQYAEAIETHLQGEDVDPDWAIAAESKIREAFSLEELQVGASVVNVDCRSTLCRLDVLHNTEEEAELADFRFNLLSQIVTMLPRGTMQVVDQGGGQTSTVLYLARDGHDLPKATEGAAIE